MGQPGACLPHPSEGSAREGEPRPQVLAATAGLTRSNRGTEHLGAWTGANTQAGLGQRDSSQPGAPHRRPPPNPFTKQELQGRKGGEAGKGCGLGQLEMIGGKRHLL